MNLDLGFDSLAQLTRMPRLSVRSLSERLICQHMQAMRLAVLDRFETASNTRNS